TTKLLVINSAVQPIFGTTGICAGSSTTLNDNDFGGTWSSGTPAVATASPSTGIITGVNAGTAIITYATSAGCRDIATFTVNPLPAAITGAASGVCLNATIALGDITPGGNWMSDDPQIASVDYNSGVVSGIGAGVTNITYTTAAGCVTAA